MKKQRQHKKTTRPKRRRRPELFTEPVRSNSDTRQHKTTQDNTRQHKTTQDNTRQYKSHEQQHGPARTRTQRKETDHENQGFFFFRTSKNEKVLVRALERVGCGTSLGAKRSYYRFHEVEIGKRQEERRRAKNE